MTNFNYNAGIPAANNNPSVDQNPMLENFTSINQIVAVDHVTFNTNNGGQHLQVTYNNISSQTSQTDPQSVSFTANDSSGHPNNFFKNSQGTFFMSCIKAFGCFNATTGMGNVTLAAGQYYNVNPTVTKPNAAAYAITLVANAVSGTNVVIFATESNNSSPSYSLTGSVLTLSNTSSVNTPLISFIILQA